jgi:hypothetical protein
MISAGGSCDDEHGAVKHPGSPTRSRQPPRQPPEEKIEEKKAGSQEKKRKSDQKEIEKGYGGNRIEQKKLEPRGQHKSED